MAGSPFTRAGADSSPPRAAMQAGAASVALLSLLLICATATADAQESLDPERDAMYARYMALPTLIKGGTICADAGALGGAACSLNWMADGQSFWFAEGQPDQTVIYRADPAAGTTEPLFDTGRVREALTAALGHEPPYGGLPFDSFTFSGEGERVVRFSVDERGFELDLDSYSVTARPASAVEAAERARPRVVREGFTSGAPAVMEVPSPDGRWLLTEKDDGLWLRATFDGREQAVLEDGEEDFAWSVEGAMWAPDGARVAAMRVDNRAMERVPIVHWLKQTEEVEWAPYAKAGNPLPRQELHIVDVHARRAVAVDVGEAEQILSPVGWLPDGSEYLFLRMLRTYRTLHLVAADPATGETRVVLEETQPTFIKGIGTTPSWRALARPLTDGERFLWISERDGWDHIYLYGMDGRLIRRLTEGAWPVTGIVHVDEAAGTVYFNGHREERPYDTHLYSVPLDGGEIVRLTEGDGQHSTAISPNGAYLVATHSSTSRPPRTEMRTTSGELVYVVSEADVSALDELGWTPPEEFVVKAADGETDLHGLIYKPHDFDPAVSYPVIDYIYNGPFISWVPKTFTDGRGLSQAALAQLGFVVFMVDGRGTTERGKAFQDVAYRNFGRNEIPDHRAAMENAAATRPWMDLDRVGIHGGSWGGYMTVRAMLLEPDFYDVGVATNGVYDIHDQNAWAIEPYMDRPWENPEGYEYGSSLRLAENLKGQLLLIHGTSDVNATFSATMKLVEALIRAGKPHDLIVVPEQPHWFTGQSAAFTGAASRRYFQEHLLGLTGREREVIP